MTRILMNLPHIVIGGFAAFTGFVLARRWAPEAAAGRRWMLRWAKRAVLGLVVLAVVVRAPVVWIEGRCTSPRDPRPPARPALVDEPGYARRESDSYLSFPEWHIVYAYEDLAGVLRGGTRAASPTAGRSRASGGACAAYPRRHRAGARGLDTQVMLYTIGWSFTAELGIKGAYEKTIGRLFEWRAVARRPRRTSSRSATCGPTRRSSVRRRGTRTRSRPAAGLLAGDAALERPVAPLAAQARAARRSSPWSTA